ncbi:MAG TPA: hypothetical protein VKS82_05210 [Streptosporangiaceae bacterium]|nr:hypothetical protein [Streptosporangiaceae bacterium]
MRKPVGALLTLASATLALGLAASSASASTIRATWTVSPGGSTTGAAGTTKVTDVTAGLTVTCTSSSFTSSFKTGSGLSGTGLGTITSLNFKNCMVDGITLSLSSGPVTYSVNGASYASGVTHGTISKIHFTVSSSECSAVIDGTGATAHNGKVKITYTNSTGVLKILTKGSTLHVYKVNGCLGAISNGDAGNISAAFKVTPKQKITSP